MKKKLLALVLVVVMAATAVIGGTMAYLTDEDSDVNVMTLGNVSIEQIEQEWNADKTELQPFTQEKPLYPYVGAMGWETTDGFGNAYRRFTMNNVVDKYVSVKNTGKSDAYVRTLVALEMGEYSHEAFDMVGISINLANGSEYQFEGAWSMTDCGVVAIDGHNYNVIEFVYANPVKPGDTTIPSLLQVYLSKDATNETVEKLDGNDNGTYDILVLSQAVQTAGFEDAATALDTGFGKVADNAAVWLAKVLADAAPNGDDDTVTYAAPADATVVVSAADLATAVNEGKTTLLLKEGTYNIPSACKGKTLNLYGESKNVIIEIAPAGQGEANGQLDYNFDGSTVTFNGLTIKTNSNTYAGYARLTGTYNDCVFEGHYSLQRDSEFNYCTFNVSGDQYNIWTWGAPHVEINYCTFNCDGKAILVYNQSCNLTVSNCVFNDNGAISGKAAIEACNGDSGTNCVTHNITVTHSTVNGFDVTSASGTSCGGTSLGTTLWGNKNLLDDDHLNVTVDGIVEY